MANLTAGYSFGSTEQVTNSKLASLVNSGTVSSIVDADISSSAAITLSKINITAASINYDRLNLGGNIVNADINASAAIATSKINFGSAHQGDIFVDTGAGITRLTPGTNGQFLQTQGASANPQWATPTPTNVLSNVLFQYQGQIDSAGSLTGELTNSSLVPSTGTATYRFLVANGASPIQLFSSKFIKISGINTVTVYVRSWSRQNNTGSVANMTISVGGQTCNILSTANSTTPTWYSSTINVSGLSNGTAYDVTATLYDSVANVIVYCANIIGFGS